MPKLTWQNLDDIALALYEKFPDLDPTHIRFTDLHKWITELEDFEDDPLKSNEAKLEGSRWRGWKNTRTISRSLCGRSFSFLCGCVCVRSASAHSRTAGVDGPHHGEFAARSCFVSGVGRAWRAGRLLRPGRRSRPNTSPRNFAARDWSLPATMADTFRPHLFRT